MRKARRLEYQEAKMRLARHLKPGSGGNRKSPSTYDPRIDAAIIAVYDALQRRDRKNKLHDYPAS